MAEGKTSPNPPLQRGGKRELEQSIFATIAYYDYFNYPLTAGEIYQYLVKINPNDQISNPNQIPSPNEQINYKLQIINYKQNTKYKIQTNIKESEQNKKSFCHSERSDSGVKNPARMCDPSHSREILRQAQDDNIKTQPNTKYEISDTKQNLKPIFSEITETLDNSEKLKKTIGRKNGFYFLAGREEIIAARIQKKKLADEKLRKSKWLLKFVSLLPFIKFIAISGSMGIGNPDRKSDIDLLVVAKHDRIWITRAFLTFFALALGAYRHSDKTANRLCLNHYITDESLAIDFGNLYKAQEYLNLFPVSGDIDLYKKFINANAGWLREYIYPNLEDAGNENLYFIRLGKISSAIKQTAEFLLAGAIGDWLENQFRKIQIYYIQKNPLTNHPHSRIRYTDDNLVFHPILVEPKIIAEWEEKMKKLEAII